MFSVKTLRIMCVIATFVTFIMGNFIEAITLFAISLLMPEED